MRIPDKVLQTINTAYTHIAQTRMGTAFVTGRGMAMELELRRTLVLYFVVQRVWRDPFKNLTILSYRSITKEFKF
jgi:hypothetical protein